MSLPHGRTLPAQRISLITLGVDDLERARQFYAKLGWQPHVTLPEIIFYQLNGMVLGLFGRDALAKDQNRQDTPLGTGAMTLAQNFTHESAVDHAFAQAISAGARELKTPAPTFWGGYAGYFADPDGHVWELAYNPFWNIAADGQITMPPQE